MTGAVADLISQAPNCSVTSLNHQGSSVEAGPGYLLELFGDRLNAGKETSQRLSSSVCPSTYDPDIRLFGRPLDLKTLGLLLRSVYFVRDE
jgi:hypothetical protein